MISEYHNLNFLSICHSLESDKTLSANTELHKILEITSDVMDVTITEEDLEVVSIEDASPIARTLLRTIIRDRNCGEPLYRRNDAVAVPSVASEFA